MPKAAWIRQHACACSSIFRPRIAGLVHYRAHELIMVEVIRGQAWLLAKDISGNARYRPYLAKC